MLHAEPGVELDFNQPITILRYLLEIWKHQSGNIFNCGRGRGLAAGPAGRDRADPIIPGECT